MAFAPISRRILQDGTQYIIYSSPQCYKNSSGEYKNIDLEIKDTTSTIGNIKLVSTVPISMGTRTDANQTKFIGFRPDENQSGSEQLEFSISTVLIDGANVSIDLTQSEVTDLYTDLTSLRILRSKIGYRQLFKVPESGITNSFRIEYVLNVTGLDVSEDNGEYIFSNNGTYRFKIGKPCVMDSDYNQLAIDVSHELTLESEGVYRYVKHVESFDFTKFDDVAYLDATTQFASYDGAPKAVGLSWSGVRGATAAGYILGGPSGTYAEQVSCGRSPGFFGSGDTFHIRRYLLEFSVAAISGINVGYYYNYCSRSTTPRGTHIITKGTQTGSVSNLDYDELDFTTPYSTPYYVPNWVEGYNGVALNKSAIDAVNSGSLFNIVDIDYTYDFLNVSPSVSFVSPSYRLGYFVEYTGTSRDPYIWVDTKTYGDLLSSSNF